MSNALVYVGWWRSGPTATWEPLTTASTPQEALRLLDALRDTRSPAQVEALPEGARPSPKKPRNPWRCRSRFP